MRGQPKRLPETRNGEKCGEKSFYMYDFQKTLHTKLRQMLSSHPAVCLLDPAFVLLCAHFLAPYFSVYWVLGSLRLNLALRQLRKTVFKNKFGQENLPTSFCVCTTLFLYKNVVFPAQAEYSYFSAEFRLKIFLYYS